MKHSIYIHPDYLHSGIGRVLLPALIDACAAAGYRQMIGYIDAANASLDRAACNPADFNKSDTYRPSATSSAIGPTW